MTIISEDDESETGFWHGAVYQYHRTANVGRELKTRAGPLLLEGSLEVGFARIAEIRKGVGQANVAHPRLSVRREDAARCEAVLTPLTRGEDGLLREDRSQPPLLVPLSLLG